jgi:hypothetical protein
MSVNQADLERRAMERANELWRDQGAAIKLAREALERFADLKYEEYVTVRGCSPEAAAGVVRDSLKQYGDAGLDISNRLAMARVF